MNIVILIANRLEKFFGNIFKIFFSLIHWIMPNKRFAIPSIDPAKKNIETNSKIPKIIWQTNFTSKVTLPLYVNYLFNRLLSRDCEYRFVDDQAMDKFISENGTAEEKEAFFKLTVGAARADFWRVFVLNKIGGVYIDFEANFVWPISKILKNNPDYLFISRDKRPSNAGKDFTNFFIASKPNNPILQSFMDDMVEGILNNNPSKLNVYNLTGPGVFNRILDIHTHNYKNFRYVCIQNTFSTDKYQYIDRPNTKWSQYTVNQILKKDE